jgi:4-carboxymuconolactone decarboxylase
VTIHPVLPLVDRDALDGKAREVYDQVAESRGGSMPNVFATLAHSSGALDRVAALGAFVRFDSGLDDQLREAVILIVAADLHCIYEYSHHHPLARELGMDPDLLARTGTPEADARLHQWPPALRYARLVSRNEEAPDDLIAELLDTLGAEGLVELTITVGYYGKGSSISVQ